MEAGNSSGGPSSVKGLLILIITFIFIASCHHAYSVDIFAKTGVIRPRVRKEAPDFKLQDIKGKIFQLSTHRGDLILLNFWATWCAPCREEMPALEKLWRELRSRGLLIVAISVDISSGEVKKFVKKYNISYPVLIDKRGRIRKLYEIRVLPTTYIIGRDGKFTGKILGARDWAGDEIKRLLKEIDPTLFLPRDDPYKDKSSFLYPTH